MEKKIEPEDEFRLYQKQTEVAQGKGDINVYHITLKINFDIDFTVDQMAFSACQWLMVSELLLLCVIIVNIKTSSSSHRFFPCGKYCLHF